MRRYWYEEKGFECAESNSVWRRWEMENENSLVEAMSTFRSEYN